MPKPLLEPESLLSHADFVKNLARRLLVDSCTAEDVAQGTWLAALERPPRSHDNVRGWLNTVTRNFARQWVRGETRRRRREQAAARREAVPSVAVVVERETIRSEVVRAVLELDGPTRDVILLRFYEDLPPREISRRLGLPVETVRSRLKRGLQRMRRNLDAKHGGDRRAWGVALLPLSKNSPGPVEGGALMGLSALLKTKLTAVLATTILLGGGAGVYWVSHASVTPPVGPDPLAAGPESPVSPSPADPAPRRPAAPPATAPSPDEEHRLTGRVVDQRGRPVAGATLIFRLEQKGREGGEGDREDDLPEARDPHKEEGEIARVETDEKGRFEQTFDQPRQGYVRVGRHAPGAFLESEGWRFKTSKDAVELSVYSIPAATVVVRATQKGTGEPLTEFECIFRRLADDERRHGVPFDDGRAVEAKLPLDVESGLSEYEVTLRDPRVTAPPVRIRLETGVNEEIEFRYVWGEEITGSVADADGKPIEGAIVFLGERLRMRGGRPFQPYREENLSHYVNTDGTGRFQLEGADPRVSVWHPDYSPVTVRRGDVSRIVLPPRGGLRIRFVDDEGEPRPGVPYTFDGSLSSTTDDEGGAEFSGLEAGVHTLRFDDRRFIVFNVRAGQETQFTVRPALPEVTVTLQRGGEPFTIATGGLIAGRDDMAGLYEFETATGEFTLRRVVPGRYLVITRQIIAQGSIVSDPASLDIGDADLTVRAPAGARVFIVPVDVNEAIEHWAENFTRREVSAEGEVRYDPLPRGRYRVGVVGAGSDTIVDVAQAGTEVSLTD